VAVQIGHLQIQENQVWLDLICYLYRFAAVARFPHFVTAAFKDSANQLTAGSFVIDHQHTPHGLSEAGIVRGTNRSSVRRNKSFFPGLVKYAFAPRARAAASSSSTDTTRTGTLAVCGSCRSSRSSFHPLLPGIIRSSVTASGDNSSAFCNPSSADAQTAVW